MAVPVARVHLAMAHAALPGLLPTPPATAILPAAACIVPISPAKSSSPSKAKPGRADAVDRWYAHKIRPGSLSSSSASSSSSSSGSSPRSPGSTISSPGRASSCDRWDSNKKQCPVSQAPPSASASGKKKKPADSSSNKRPVISRSSSASRWDMHKRPRAEEVGGSGNKQDVDKLRHAIVYAGQGFVAAPEPCILPVPAFLVRAS